LSQSLKDDIRRVCNSLDERVLLPAFASELRIASSGHSIQVTAPLAFLCVMLKIILCRLQVEYRCSRFVFPSDDCIILPITNTR
jgi:hypothetical protein